MGRFDTLNRTFSRLKDAIVPTDPQQQEHLRYVEMLHNLSDEQLEELHYKEHPELRPTASRDELIRSFLDIDIDAVPESLLWPDAQLSKVDYNNLLINSIERDRVDAGTVEALQKWYVWKQQNYLSSL